MPTLSIRVDENLASKLREVAEERGISVSDLIREAIIRYLKLEAEERVKRKAAEVPTDLEERIQRIESEIQAIWKKFEELEEEKMMEHIFEGFEEFLERYKEREEKEEESEG